MDENQFWTNLWRTAAMALVAIVTVIAGCVSHNAIVLKAMVEGGANPLDAKCALDSSERSAPCLLRATVK